MTCEADMRKYLRHRILNAIHDTVQFAEIAEVDRKEIASTIMAELYFELVRISIACAMSEKEYLETCRLAYRAMSRQARASLEE